MKEDEISSNRGGTKTETVRGPCLCKRCQSADCVREIIAAVLLKASCNYNTGRGNQDRNSSAMPHSSEQVAMPN